MEKTKSDDGESERITVEEGPAIEIEGLERPAVEVQVSENDASKIPVKEVQVSENDARKRPVEEVQVSENDASKRTVEEIQVSENDASKRPVEEALASTPKHRNIENRPSCRTAWRTADLRSPTKKRLYSQLSAKREENYKLKKKFRRYQLAKFVTASTTIPIFETKYSK